jgi:hypothetical protein
VTPTALLLLVAFGIGGCAGELENPERFADCQPGMVEAMFQDRCAGLCHAGDRPEADLDLTAPGVAERLIGVPSQTSFCDGRVLVDPDAVEPFEHLLLDKLSETPTCGTRMPFGASSLTELDRECVRRWIDEAIAEMP